MPYQHMVLFQFKAAASSEAVARVIADFAALPSKLPSIQTFSHGQNISPENLGQGFSHCFELRFSSQKDFLEAYLHEPAHQAFVTSLDGLLEQVLVFDYEIR